MRISNVEWLKKRIGFIRKLGEKTTRQRQIIDLLDDEDSLSETDRRLLHVLATAEKNELQEQDAAQKKAVQARISVRCCRERSRIGLLAMLIQKRVS
ncbi:hypothetical protein ACRS6L_18125 [Morganella morganii]|uniref:hypothetical protein n=1 Tax=Morganella morganii TaxID=582 RepID=UPI003EE212F7